MSAGKRSSFSSWLMLWICVRGAMSTVSAPASSRARRGSVSSTFSTPSVARIATFSPLRTRSRMSYLPRWVLAANAVPGSERAKDRDRDHASENAGKQAPPPGDRGHDKHGGEGLGAVCEAAARSDDRRADERGDDRHRQHLEIPRGRGRRTDRQADGKRQRPREKSRDRRAEDRQPDHRRVKTAMNGASAPAMITATVDAPASASPPATDAATRATAMSAGRRIARTTMPMNVAVIAKSTPNRRGSPIAPPSRSPAIVATFQTAYRLTAKGR